MLFQFLEHLLDFIPSRLRVLSSFWVRVRARNRIAGRIISYVRGSGLSSIDGANKVYSALQWHQNVLA